MSSLKIHNHTEVTLNPEQDEASRKFTQFLLDRTIREMVLEGHAGTGKTFLVRYLLTELAHRMDFIQTVLDDEAEMMDRVYITATTHKAARVLKDLTGTDVQTIHSLLGLRLKNDYKTGTKYLQATSRDTLEPGLLIIDEASFVTEELLGHIRKKAERCKVLFLGDPNQLTPAGDENCIIFNSNLFTAKLSKIMRNGGEIQKLSHQYRDVLLGGEWPVIKTTPDVRHVNGYDVAQEIDTAFKNGENAKVLAFTNAQVERVNAYVCDLLGLTHRIAKGQRRITNKHIGLGQNPILSETEVSIIDCYDSEKYGVKGQMVCVGNHWAFAPDDFDQAKAVANKFRKAKEWNEYFEIQDEWADLRHPFALTIHKSQGSTYDKAIIDLADIGRCREPSQVARMLYVAISRASKEVILGGYLPSHYVGVDSCITKNSA